VCSHATENRICQILASFALTPNFYIQVNTTELRNCVSNKYQSGQQDCTEFLFDLLAKIDVEEIRSLFEFNTVNFLHCCVCGYERREIEITEIFLTPSNINENVMCKEGLKFSEMMTKSTLRKQICCNCGNTETIHEVRREIIFPNSNKYVCLLLPLFDDNGNRYKQRKIIQFEANNLKTSNHRFKVLAAVIHSGNTLYSGHYTSIVRHELNKWILIDDLKTSYNNVRQRFVSNLDSVYCVFLERKS